MDSPADDDNSNFEKKWSTIIFPLLIKVFFADIDWIGRDDNCSWGTKKCLWKRRTRGNFAADVTKSLVRKKI